MTPEHLAADRRLDHDDGERERPPARPARKPAYGEREGPATDEPSETGALHGWSNPADWTGEQSTEPTSDERRPTDESRFYGPPRHDPEPDSEERFDERRLYGDPQHEPGVTSTLELNPELLFLRFRLLDVGDELDSTDDFDPSAGVEHRTTGLELRPNRRDRDDLPSVLQGS